MTDTRYIEVTLPHKLPFYIGIREGIVVEVSMGGEWALHRPEREIAHHFRANGARFRDVTTVHLPSGPDVVHEQPPLDAP